MHYDVNVAIVETVSNKVVISSMGDGNVYQFETIDKAVEDETPLLVLDVHITVTPQVYYTGRELF